MKKIEKGEKHSKRTQIIVVYSLNFDEALHDPESQEGIYSRLYYVHIKSAD